MPLLDAPQAGRNAVGRGLAAAAVIAVAAIGPVAINRSAAPVIEGPYARLLAESTDLGPAREHPVRVIAALDRAAMPERLSRWARLRELAVHWRTGDPWAVVEGAAEAVAAAFAVSIHRYRAPGGEVFHAAAQQPGVPPPAAGEVTGVGRILTYTPYRVGLPPTPPRDVPGGGLMPTQLVNAYNMGGLARLGATGKGSTVVVFSFDGFDQSDLDSFADWFDVPRFTPRVVGGMPSHRTGESTMDLQMIHAVAPDAALVMVNARPTVEPTADGRTAFEKLGALMESVDREFPGAVWSFSIGWGCDRLMTAADLAPVRFALAAAQRRGTTAFDASGDMAGLECRGGKRWSDPPSPDDLGVDAVASLPEMTAVGGTSLSTDATGGWLAEQAWYDVPLTQGTAGGASALFGRPAWQTVQTKAGPTDRRLVPDVAAVADPFTGVKFVFRQQVVTGGGTSQAAPLWAGIAAVINQLLTAQGLRPLGDLNPLLYAVAKGSALPGFRDIELGANAVSPSISGYDMVTGLGSPNVGNLLRDIVLNRTQRE